MMSRLFVGYAIVELAVVIALASTIGFGCTVLLLLALFFIGLAVAGSQLKRHLMQVRSNLVAPTSLVSDGASVALGTVLVVIPGLVTTAAGLLMLFPLTRPAVRPVVVALAQRSIGRVPLITVATAAAQRQAASRHQHQDFIDGEIIDVVDAGDAGSAEDVGALALPHRSTP
ncbi:MAG: FxsA family protein [Mycobacteriaceae bacterium]|nr:FxsA family protein [Mycobacteriaceae bacterium]